MAEISAKPTEASETRPAAALLTPIGRGAVATICLQGNPEILQHPPPPLFRAANGIPLALQPVQRVLYGWWGETVREEVVVCRCDENRVEIHCHGGKAAASRLLDDLQNRGVTIVTPEEMLARQHGILHAECMEALSRARTIKTANYLLSLVHGSLERTLTELLTTLQQTLRDDAPLRGKPAKKEEIMDRLQTLLCWSGFGRHLTHPWKIVVCGRPNVGKSSLINQLAGQNRAIVSDVPGTTRDVITVVTAFDGWPVELTDTAGWRETTDELEATGIKRAGKQLQQADCCLLLWDTSEPLLPEDFHLLEIVPHPLLVLHKCDLPAVWKWEEVIRTKKLPCCACEPLHPGFDPGPSGSDTGRKSPLRHPPLRVSSRTGEGTIELQQAIIHRVMPEIPPPGTPLPVTKRQIHLLQKAHDALKEEAFPTAVAVLQELLGKPPRSL